MTNRFRGARYAKACYTGWINRQHLTRRVDTYVRVDRGIIEQRVTLDVNHESLTRVIDDARKCGFHSSLVLPLLQLKREVFFDVDIKDEHGTALRLCRRHVNREMSAHILVGACLAGNAHQGAGRVLFREAEKFIELLDSLNDRRSQALRAKEARNSFIAAAYTHGIDDLGRVRNLAESLEQGFIQCVDIPINTPPYLIKFRLARASPYDSSARVGFAGISSESRGIITDSIAQLASSVGVLAPWVEVNFAPTGLGEHPSHVQFVAPYGTVIDDVEIVGADGAPMARSSEALLWKFSHERAIVLARPLRPGNYRLLVKLNPKRGQFLIPTLVAMSIQCILLAMILQVGPARVAANSAVVPALVLIPSFVTLFVVRDSEHEFVSGAHKLTRLLAVLVCAGSVICSAILAASPQGSRASPWGFWALLSDLGLGIIVTMLVGTQIARIGAMRRLVVSREQGWAEDPSDFRVLRNFRIGTNRVKRLYKSVWLAMGAAFGYGLLGIWLPKLLLWSP